MTQRADPFITQRADELPVLVDLMLSEGATSYLEVGLRRGTTFQYIGERLPVGSRLVGVDFMKKHGGKLTAEQRELVEGRVHELRAMGQSVKVLLGDSKDPKMIAQVAERGPYDLVFVDADHSALGVRTDWANYGPMGRMVAFHDIDAPNCPILKARPQKLERHGVADLWAELKQKYRHREIIGADPGQGIGVVWTR